MPADTPEVDTSEQRYGSDLMADLLRAHGFEHVVFNPGASFRGIEESIVNYNDNEPTVIESPNEGLSVAIAHGLAKASGSPACCILHNVVGTLNGAMGIYNAYIDRVPLVLLSGTGPMRKSQRRTWIEWIHTANVQGDLVRDFVKWDGQPVAVDGIVESVVRAHEVALTEPKGPTYVTMDVGLQEAELDEPVPMPDLSRLGPPTPMAPDPAAIEQAAAMLLSAELPVIVTGQVGDDADAVAALIELAESVGAAVFDPARRRFNFPNTHPLYLTGSDVYREADLFVGLDLWDVDLVTGSLSSTLEAEGAVDYDYVEVGTHELEASGLFPNTYAMHETDLAIMASTARAVPALRDAVAERLDAGAGDPDAIEDRRARLAAAHDDLRRGWWDAAEAVWDETPIHLARLTAELGDVIEGDPWTLVNDVTASWTDRLWDVAESARYTGGSSGGAGVGYGIGAAIGAAIALEGTDRIPVSIQSDGDLMQYLGGLWVLGHHDIGLMSVMYNNETMLNSTRHRMRLAEERGRDASYERAQIGTGLTDPTPDYASIAESMGVRGFGPVTDPDDLPAVLAEAWAVATAGSPVLVDVICQPS